MLHHVFIVGVAEIIHRPQMIAGRLRRGDTLVDARDGQKYATVCIGKQNWMAQNLNYAAPGSITYDNDPANGPIYGRLYDYKTTLQGADSSNAVRGEIEGENLMGRPECGRDQ